MARHMTKIYSQNSSCINACAIFSNTLSSLNSADVTVDCNAFFKRRIRNRAISWPAILRMEIKMGESVINCQHLHIQFHLTYLQSQALMSPSLTPLLCRFEYLLNMAVVLCLVLPNTLRNFLAKFIRALNAGICLKTFSKNSATTCSAPWPTVMRGCLLARISPAF
jgi:hypothetical protein